VIDAGHMPFYQIIRKLGLGIRWLVIRNCT